MTFGVKKNRPLLTLGFLPNYLLLYCQKYLASLYRRHESKKKREYAQRVREVERGAFTPLVFAFTGGMARECTTIFKRIADILFDKKKMPYSQAIHLIRCRLSFALIRSAIRAIRGSRRSRQPTVTDFNRAFTEAPFVILLLFHSITPLVLFAFDRHGVYALYLCTSCVCFYSMDHPSKTNKEKRSRRTRIGNA